MVLSKRENVLIILLVLIIITGSIFTAGAFYISKDSVYLNNKAIVSNNSVISESKTPIYIPPQKLANPPKIVKAVYVTGYSAGSKKYLEYLTDIFKTTEINSVVVDIKDSSGYVSYNSGVADVGKYNIYSGAVKDIDVLINFFHDKNIYVIGRIAVFEDPMYSQARPELAIYNKTETLGRGSQPSAYERGQMGEATDLEDISKRVLWKDNNKLSWLDPASKDAWDYNISLAKDALYHGFDEINFDYIRFPSDGSAGIIGYPIYDGKKAKSEVIKEFFEYTRQRLGGDPPSPGSPASAWRGKISADLFGQTTVNKDDMGIGQIIENAFKNFDYIAPMVYPSHYINGFIGFENPADNPYDIVKYSMDKAIARELAFLDKINNPAPKVPVSSENLTEVVTPTAVPIVDISSLAKFRPWLQDFDMKADYTVDMVKAEIKATQDALGDNYAGFMLWNPRNIYTTEAVLKIEKK